MTTESQRDAAAAKGWTPIRRGKIYCSPRCGGACTWEAYQQAMKGAAKLVTDLEGPGWQGRVWENLGWHYAAAITLDSGTNATVHVGQTRPKYTASVNTAPQFRDHSDSPRVAFAKAMKAAVDHLTSTKAELDQLTSLGFKPRKVRP